MLLLLVAMAGIVPVFISSLNHSSVLRHRSLATNIARELMEDIRQLDYREITTDADEGKTLQERFGTSASVRGIDFDVSYTVTEESAMGQGTLKQVTVTVGWTGPPAPSSASLTTLIHQQYLGPRGAHLTVTPHYSVPGTPYWRVYWGAIVRYYIAEADWGLIFSDVTQPSTSMRDVYARFELKDDTDRNIKLGPSGNDYKLGKPYIDYTTDASGALTGVWFEWLLLADSVPDGYWTLSATAYNAYDQPGNTWRVRLLFEHGAPAPPTDFVALPQLDNQTVILYWVAGPEADRSHFVLRRSTYDVDTGTWGPYVTLSDSLDPNANSYVDAGNVDSQSDPWGRDDHHNYYRYSLYAVDQSSPPRTSPAVTAIAEVPGTTTTTTPEEGEEPTTTTSSSTTTTSTTTPSPPPTLSVKIENETNKDHSITIECGSSQVYSGTAKSNSTLIVSGLEYGTYVITAKTNANGWPTLTQEFTLDSLSPDGQVVMTILKSKSDT